jgi:hypothetical protein
MSEETEKKFKLWLVNGLFITSDKPFLVLASTGKERSPESCEELFMFLRKTPFYSLGKVCLDTSTIVFVEEIK